VGNEQAADESVLASVERRLARLRFDLHDGPQQDVHLLAADLEHFRQQLTPSLAGNPNASRLLGRLDDLAARLVKLDEDIRRLVTTLQSPLVAQTSSLAEALAQIVDEFAQQTGIKPGVQLEGELAELTDSQQIALASLVREALSNIRKHSEARTVAVMITARAGAVDATITDDGRGFDPDEALATEPGGDHLGLLGMHERARMLGGRTSVESKPGGPTTVSVSLPPWRV
jgi:signal transduction histidine kinase